MTKLGRHEEDRATDKALLKLAGAHVYSQEFTLQYMQAELDKRPAGALTRRMGDIWADNMKFAAAIAAALGCFMLSQGDIIPFRDYLGDGLLGVKCLFAAAGFAAAYFCLDRTWCRPSSVWQTHRLERDGTYAAFGEQATPEFVQSLMRDIRTVLPESAFAISVLGLDPIITCRTQRGIYTVLIYDGDTVILEK
jgi:hypothetical protein